MTKTAPKKPAPSGVPIVPRVLDAASEDARARATAERLGIPFVDLWTFRVDAALFRATPLEWMLRFEFVPEKEEDGVIHVVMADPTDVIRRDELEGLLKKRIRVKVGSWAAMQEILQKSESTQRVLEEATEDFRMQVVREDEEGQEVLTIDRIAADASPIIKLVDSVLFHGEDSVIRILDKESANAEFKNLRLDVLGMDPDTMRRLRKFIREPYGMVLVTGPTGSGKTTTLYACLSEIQSVEDKIITIEDPVEYQLRGITQIPVNEKKGLTFARGLRSILRHDPDKVMVGEIRDEETAQIAVQAALTGHLVFTTVHANNVVDVLGRFLNMKVELYNFVSALNCILAQRLVRKICPHCKIVAEPSKQLLEESALSPREIEGSTFYEGRGCIECNGTGFYGRMAITELLDLSDRIRGLILDRRPAAEIKKAAKDEGMAFLRESALRKAILGETTLKEINKVTFVD